MDPVLVHIRHRKALVLGLPFAVLTLFFCAFASLGIWAGSTNPTPYWIAFGGIVLFGWFAAVLLGLGIRRPVALRMDAHGISGYYTAPAAWSEIKGIGVMKGGKGNKFLGFRLQDPIAFRDRQTSLQRVTSWINGATDGYHISIADNLLKDADINALSQQAQAFHRAACPPHVDVT